MKNINLSCGIDECRMDCTALKHLREECIEGEVKDNHNKPIVKVCVKLLDENYDPLVHTVTDCNGKFTLVFPCIQGCFLVFSKQGYITKTLDSFNNKINLILEERQKTCLVSGRVYSKDCKPVASARLVLCNSQTSKVAYTNEDGSFTFTMTPPGEYTLTIDGNNCRKKTTYIKIPICITSLNLGIIFVEEIDILCTINGIVTNDKKEPVNSAVVVLYNAYNKQPIAHTLTNEDGLYFFGNVYQGCYFVEAFE